MIFSAEQCLSNVTTYSVINWAVIRINGTLCAGCTVVWSVDFGSMVGWISVDNADDALFLYRPYGDINPETGVIAISAKVYCADQLLGHYTATLTLIP